MDFYPTGSSLDPPDFRGKRRFRKANLKCPRCGREMFQRGILRECPGCNHQVSAPMLKRRRRDPQPIDNVVEQIRQQVELYEPERPPHIVPLEIPVRLSNEAGMLPILFILPMYLSWFWLEKLHAIDSFSITNPLWAWATFGFASAMLGLFVFSSSFAAIRYLYAALMLLGVVAGMLQVLSLLTSDPILSTDQPAWTGWLLGICHLCICSWVLYYLERERKQMGW